MLKHLAEAIDLRLHALQFGLVRGAVQHRDGRWRIAASDMRQLLAAGAVIFQAAQPLLYALVGLLQLLILRKRLR